MNGLCSLVLGILIAQAGADRGSPSPNRATEPLVRALPTDSVAVLVVDRLGEHLDFWRQSQSWKQIQALPGFQLWLASPDYARLQSEVGKVEALLGLSTEELLRSILGRAMVLSLHPDAQVDGGYAGLVLIQSPDVARLRALVERLESLDVAGGKAIPPIERTEGELSYWVRTKGAGGPVSDAFALSGDGQFAWSNSESVIRAYLKRTVSSDAGESQNWFVESRDAIARSVLELHVSDALWRVKGNVPTGALEDRVPGSFEVRLQKWAASCRGISLGLSDDDGLSVRLVTRFPAVNQEESFLKILATAPDIKPFGGVSTDSWMIGRASIALNTKELAALIFDLLDEKQAAQWKHLELLASAILGEGDALRSILGRMGPQVCLMLGQTDERGVGRLLQRGLELRVAVQYQGGQPTASQLQRLVQAVFALMALGDKQTEDQPDVQVETSSAGAILRLVSQANTVVARITGGWLILGNLDSGGDWLEAGGKSAAPERLPALEPGLKAQAEVMAGSLRSCLERNREYWIRESSRANGSSAEQAAREYEQALELMSLLERVSFRAWLSTDSSRFTQKLTLQPATSP